MSTTTSAIVTLTLTIPVGSTWGKECKLDQVFSQAVEEAKVAIRHALGDRVEIVQGSVSVKAITTEMK